MQYMIVQSCVAQEITWLKYNSKRPHSVTQHPSTKSIEHFQTLLMDSPHSSLIDNLDMTPDELARLCHNRYISGDHIRWFVNKVNEVIQETHCVYLNAIQDVKRHIENKVHSPIILTFIINVGRHDNANVFIGDDSNPGNHWVFLYYDSRNNSIKYCDSLGWAFPENLLKRVCEFISIIYGVSISPVVSLCHQPDSIDNTGRHICNDTCTLYPLQTCYNIYAVLLLFLPWSCALFRNKCLM